MGWVAVAGAVLKLIIMLLGNKFEKDKKKREKREAYLARAKEGIKNRDVSSITAYFDAARRVR